MGSPLRLAIDADGGDLGEGAAADRAWQAVVDEFAACDEAMSRFRDDSEITRLNRAAGADRSVRVSTRLRQALSAADRARRMTGGRFDARVLADLDRLGYRGARLPDAGLGAARAPRVSLERDGVRLDRPVDLGGIGKGLALRRAADRIRAIHPRASFLLEAGGDIVARGLPPEGGPWLIGVEDPTGAAAPLAVIAVGDGAVATSSVRINRWRAAGRVVHHLIDPATGDAAESGLLAVTVAQPDPAWAEVWSKALFVAGRRAIADEARARSLAAWWVCDDGRLEMTPAARQQTAWAGGER